MIMSEDNCFSESQNAETCVSTNGDACTPCLSGGSSFDDTFKLALEGEFRDLLTMEGVDDFCDSQEDSMCG